MIYIYTVCYNTPEFILYQYKLFKKYINNNFEYIVFNNTQTDLRLSNTNTTNNNILVNICEINKITYIDIPPNILVGCNQDASTRCGIAIDFATQYMLKTYINSDINTEPLFFLIDADAFLITEFDIKEFMYNCKLSGRYQYRINTSNQKNNYITNQLVIYKPKSFTDSQLQCLSFKPGIFNNNLCDCGGSINYILSTIDNKEFKNWKNFLFSDMGNRIQSSGGNVSTLEHYNMDYIKYLIHDINNYIKSDTLLLKNQFPFCEILVHDKNYQLQFLHLRAGTNWINYDINKRKQLLYNLLNKLLLE
jgi:hypothetical protein